MVKRHGLTIGLFIVACLFLVLSSSSVSRAQKEKEAVKEQGHSGRYSIVAGVNKDDAFFVIDSSTGQVWGYTSRSTSGFRWVDYGIPHKVGASPPVLPLPATRKDE
jgi:hypothetical protein